MRVLRGIANATDAALLPAARPFLSHSSFGVREAAVHAVQRMSVSEVDELLRERLERDPHASVRSTAATALGLRVPSAPLARALAQAGMSDPDAHVRSRAITVMGTWLAAQPELRTALQTIATRDREPKLRQQAQSAIEAAATSAHAPG